jgi:hypothetical protein
MRNAGHSFGLCGHATKGIALTIAHFIYRYTIRAHRYSQEPVEQDDWRGASARSICELLHQPELGHAHPAVLPLPCVQRLLAHAELPADVRGLRPGLGLAQRVRDLLLGVPSMFSCRPPRSVRTTCVANPQAGDGSIFGNQVRSGRLLISDHAIATTVLRAFGVLAPGIHSYGALRRQLSTRTRRICMYSRT